MRGATGNVRGAVVWRVVTLLVAIITLDVCATASNRPETPSDRVLATTDSGTVRSHELLVNDSVLNVEPDAALAALQAAYEDLGIEIKMLDHNTRQIGNKRFAKMYELKGVRLSKYVGCGITETGPAADSYRVTMSIVSRVIPSGTGSRISTRLTAYAEDLGSSKGTLSCMTLGSLEQRINELAVKHAGG
jgi:hypothetical protein